MKALKRAAAQAVKAAESLTGRRFGPARRLLAGFDGPVIVATGPQLGLRGQRPAGGAAGAEPCLRQRPGHPGNKRPRVPLRLPWLDGYGGRASPRRRPLRPDR